ncbi:CIR protein, partial [Plasmodium chabaudi adami]
CGAFDKIDTKISLDPNDPYLNSDDHSSLNKYCPFLNNDNGEKCNNYEEIIISTFITFLVSFISSNDGGYLDSDKLGEYVILWLCYQLNLKTENSIDNLNKFYNKYINAIKKYVEGSHDVENHNSCMDIINKKQYLMNMDIKKMSRLYEALKALCKLYNECNDKKENYTHCSQDANDFVKEFEKLNGDFSITGDNLYREILSSLSTNYDDFKNDCAKNCSKCSDIPTLPDINLPKSSGVTSPSSSIEKTLIPVLLAFAIPLFFGIAYKVNNKEFKN